MFDEKYLKEQMKNLNIQLELLKQRQEYSYGFFALSQSQLYPNNSMNYIPDYQNPLIVPDTSNPINTNNEMEAGALLTKLMNIMDSNQAQDVIDNLDDSEISTLNTFFTDFTNSIKKKEVKFKSSEQILDYIKLYVSKNSYTNLQTSYPNPEPKQIGKDKKDKKVDNIAIPETTDFSLFDDIGKLNHHLMTVNMSTNEIRKNFLKQYIDVLTSNIKAGNKDEQDDLNAIRVYINETKQKKTAKITAIESSKILQQLITYIQSKYNGPVDTGAAASIYPEPPKQQLPDDIKSLNQYILTSKTLDTSELDRLMFLRKYHYFIKIEPQSLNRDEMITLIDQSLIDAGVNKVIKLDQTDNLKLLNDMRAYIKANIGTSNGFGFKTQRRKIGSGSSVDFEKNKIYLDMSKLNDNVMSIKYRKTGNKIMDEIPINHVVRNVILSICMKQFDKKKYEKLSIEEKKIACNIF
jgi:hypothetical protein